jgi:hypothetical protein
LTDAATNNLSRHVAVTHRSVRLYTIVGAIVLLAALRSPEIAFGNRRRYVRRGHGGA